MRADSKISSAISAFVFIAFAPFVSLLSGIFKLSQKGLLFCRKGEASNGAVSRHILSPDLFGHPPQAQQEAAHGSF